jgi:hypothetical protein
VSAHSTNPIAKYDEGTHKTAGVAFLVVFSMAQGNTMNQGTGIEGRVDGSGGGVGSGDRDGGRGWCGDRGGGGRRGGGPRPCRPGPRRCQGWVRRRWTRFPYPESLLPLGDWTANRNSAFRAGNWSAIGNTLTSLAVTDGKSARCRDVCHPPTLAKDTVERQAASEYRVGRTREPTGPSVV